MATVAQSVAAYHQDLEQAVVLTNTSLEQFRAGLSLVDAALDSVDQTAEFLQQNWDPQYDARLRESGFQGSLFILREFKMHLESMRQTVRGVIKRQRAIAKELSDGPIGKDPFLGTATRLMCQSIMRFLEFEDRVAQTQLSFFTAEREGTA